MAQQRCTLSYQGKEIAYYLNLREQNNIILRIREGKILISAPFFTPTYEIEKLIYKNISKVLEIQNKYEVRMVHELFSSNPWIKVMDEKIKINLVQENVHTKMENKVITMKDYLNTDEQITKLYSFLAKQYKNWFISRTVFWANLMETDFKNVSVKIMKQKWGVCYPQTQKIVYNTKLLHFEQDIIDYVIVHELAHTIYPNHSKEFWRLVEKFLPNYKERQTMLNSVGI